MIVKGGDATWYDVGGVPLQMFVLVLCAVVPVDLWGERKDPSARKHINTLTLMLTR